ncbi:MAG: sensor histidine kinase [Actinobacteria bacterium]|nr:MAG: sensor histidine kinase [Actinomycetota bacterium]
MSLRTRLLLTTSAIVLVVVTALSVGVSTIVSRQLLHEVDKSLDARIEVIASSLLENRQTSPNGMRMQNPLTDALMPMRFDTVTQVIDANGSIFIALGEVDLPITQQVLNIANNPNGGLARSTVTISDVRYRILTVPLVRGGALQLAKDISDIERAKSGIRQRLIGIGLFGILVAAAAGWWVARRTAKPIQQLANAAEHIALTQQLDTTLDIHGDREVEQLADSFNTMLSALRLSSDRQKQLVQDTSHELRTPLTSLRANSELLERDTLDTPTRNAILRDIRAEVDELTSLSSELAALASDQRLVEEPTAIDLGEAATEVATRASRRTGRTVTVVANAPQVATVRIGQFERALNNLVDNALKFCPTAQPVEVIVNGKRISVVDHGPGISDADKPLVFDRFYRATATRALPGSGLGLAIVKQFADDHGATVSVSDTPGGGATVTIQFT